MADDKKILKEASNVFHSIMKASVSKRAVELKYYSENIANEIRTNLLRLRTLSTEKQKGVRTDLRDRLDFHIEHFTKSKKGFTAEDFDNLIKEGKIKIS